MPSRKQPALFVDIGYRLLINVNFILDSPIYSKFRSFRVDSADRYCSLVSTESIRTDLNFEFCI
jgi:hypothetical protein